MKLANSGKATQRGNLTYEKLKTYKGFENITEAEAEKEIENIRRLAKVLHYLALYDQQAKQEQENETENEND